MNSVTTSLNWQWQAPLQQRYNYTFTEDSWLQELSEMRGEVLFDNGRRPLFKQSNGKFADPDVLDTYAYHLLAKSDDRIVGCVRVIPLISSPTSITESLLGRSALEHVLQEIGSHYSHTVEASRWMVHPDFRGSRVSLGLAAGMMAIADHLNFKTMIAMAGTHDGQDRYLMHMGLLPLPGIPLVKAPEFDDELRIVHYDVSQPPNSLVRRWYSKMESLLKTQLSEDELNPVLLPQINMPFNKKVYQHNSSFEVGVF
jgi:N-acyl-L-homoserine lactone synthetase